MAKAKNTFFNDLVEVLKDEYTTIASDGTGSAEFSGFHDSGSLAFNAALSGSMMGGFADNKVTMLAGESATGKTFFALGVVKYFLDSNPTAGVIYYDTEAAVTKDMMESRGIDTKRVVLAAPETLQKFREHALKILDHYSRLDADKRPKMMMVLDSLGMLPTTKESGDTLEGKETKDMTRPGIVRSIFRVLTLKLAKAKVPLILTNHTYAGIGSMFPTQEIAGGGGGKYAASVIVAFSKRKEKEGTEVVGNIIHCKLLKSRLTKENKMVDVMLRYDTGLDRYYGLLPIAEKYGIFEKVATKWKVPGHEKPVFEVKIIREPEKYYTPEVLALIEEACKKEFMYGGGDHLIEELEDE